MAAERRDTPESDQTDRPNEPAPAPIRTDPAQVIGTRMPAGPDAKGLEHTSESGRIMDHRNQPRGPGGQLPDATPTKGADQRNQPEPATDHAAQPRGFGTRMPAGPDAKGLEHTSEPGRVMSDGNQPQGSGGQLPDRTATKGADQRNQPEPATDHAAQPRGFGTRMPAGPDAKGLEHTSESGRIMDHRNQPQGPGGQLPDATPTKGADQRNQPEPATDHAGLPRGFGTRMPAGPDAGGTDHTQVLGQVMDHGNQPRGFGTKLPDEPEAESHDRRPDSALLSSTLSSRLEGSSAIHTYQDMMVGSRSWWALIRHELLVGFGGALPGALGLAFRKLFWKNLFNACGGNAVFGRGVVLRQPLKMKVGARLLVDDDTLLDAKVAPVGGFELGDDVLISRGCTIVAAEGPLRLGNRVSIGNGCTIMAGSGVEIGDDTMLAAHCYIGGGTYEIDEGLDRPMREQPGLAGRVVIGPGCWLGAGAIVLSGVTVGKGAVIGAGALVARDVPDHAVVTGVPATIRRFRHGARSPGEAPRPMAHP